MMKLLMIIKSLYLIIKLSIFTLTIYRPIFFSDEIYLFSVLSVALFLSLFFRFYIIEISKENVEIVVKKNGSKAVSLFALRLWY